jgi:4-hydroxy-tetrahydrodipicolinate reductase
MAGEDERFELVAALTKPGCPTVGSVLHAGDRSVVVTETLDTECDVLVDFAVASGTMAWLEVCREHGIPLVTGATGHDEEQLARMREVARSIPILKASNFSLGIQAILRLVGPLAKELGDAYDAEIVESHHRRKVDAPSGTALTLVQEIVKTTGRSKDKDVVFGRHGHTGEKPPRQIGVHAVRMGDGIGWHEVHFAGPGETITIRHNAHSRETFAAGALKAAAWIIGKPPGFYTMHDVLD